jgi:hypothetical protein
MLAYLYCFSWASASCVRSSLTPLLQEIRAVAKVKVSVLSLLSWIDFPSCCDSNSIVRGVYITWHVYQITVSRQADAWHLADCWNQRCAIHIPPPCTLSNILYVQVTVHRNNLRINNQQDASSIQNCVLSRNCTWFGRLLCPSSGVISCTRGSWYVSCRLCGRCLGESVSNLTEICRVSWQNKILDTWFILLVIYTKTSVPYLHQYMWHDSFCLPRASFASW